MARLIGPDESVRVVYLPSGLAKAQGYSAIVYSDAGGTTLADILTVGGAAVTGSTLTVDAYSKIPLFQFPDGVDTVYVVVNGGPISPLYARTDDRLDAISTTATAAADRTLSNLTSASAARTNLELGDAAVLDVGTAAGTVAAGDAAAAKIPLTQRGAASGVATLDSATQLPVDQLTAGWDAPVVRPPYPQPSTILTTLQPSHSWTNNAGSTLTTDTTDFILGAQSVKITTGGLAAQANLSRTGMTSFDTTGKVVRLRFKVADITNMAEIGCFLGSSSFASYYKWSIQVTGGSKFIQSGEWVTITLSWHDAISSGSPSRSALTDARFYVIDNAAGAVAVNWQSFELIPDGSETWPNGVISICFDDSYSAQWTMGKKTLDLYGFPATAYTITDYIGTAGRLTLDQLKAMQDRSGWEIAGHANTAVNHSASYTGLTAAALESDTRGQHAWLMDKGFRAADGTAYPLGQFGLTSDSGSTTDIVRRHWGYARTTHSRTKETYPPADRWRLRAVSAISTFSGGYAPSSITTAVTGDIAKCAANKSHLILVFHNIVASGVAATSEILQSDYDAIIAAVAASGIPVRTVGEVMRTTPGLPLTGGAIAGDLVVQSTPTAQRRIETTSYFETDSSGTAESIRLHFGTPSGKTGNSAKNAIAFFDDAISTTQSQVWLQSHRYLHWYNAFSFLAAAVTTATDTITSVAHGLPSTPPAWRGQFTTTGTLPTGLSLVTNYYVARVTVDTVKVYTDAAATLLVDITGQGSGTHTFTPDNTFYNNEHRHFSVEVSNADLTTKNTRFSVPWGYDTTEIGFFQANVNVVDGKFRITGASGAYRQLQLCNTLSDNLVPDGTEGRWSVQADSTAESGSNVGSDFRITRHTDAGVASDAPLFIKRSTGFVGIGGVTSPGTALDVGPGTGTVATRINRGSNVSTFASLVLATSSTDRWNIQLRNDSTNDLHFRNAVQGLTSILIEDRATAPNMSFLTSTKSYGGGVGVIFVASASTVPSSSPTGGGILYVEAGALKYRGTSGTVTTVGAA